MAFLIYVKNYTDLRGRCYPHRPNTCLKTCIILGKYFVNHQNTYATLRPQRKIAKPRNTGMIREEVSSPEK